MNRIVEKYIDRVLLYADLPPAKAENTRKEMRDHLLQKIEDLCAAGVERDEAVFQALRSHGKPSDIGYRLRGGFPWIDVRARGVAKGVIAIGPRAVGILAFGGMAMGVIAVGGVAMGPIGIGGVALGLLVWGGVGLGGLSFAGVAIAAVAMGGLAIGLVASGGTAIGALIPSRSADVAMSYFTSKTAPAWLKSLAGFLAVPSYLAAHMGLIMPVYLALLGIMIFMQIREGRRLAANSDDDWLIEG